MLSKKVAIIAEDSDPYSTFYEARAKKLYKTSVYHDNVGKIVDVYYYGVLIMVFY
jgi:hypothetical protein